LFLRWISPVAVEIPAIQNATAFDFKCGVAPNLGEPCDFFYTLDVNVTAGDMVLLYASASSAANVSLGAGACPSADAFVTLDATGKQSKLIISRLSYYKVI
jgi:hypothetical protein